MAPYDTAFARACLAAWLTAAEPAFGGSLDDTLVMPADNYPQRLPLPRTRNNSDGSGIPYVYRHRHGWQFRAPGRYKLHTKLFRTLTEAGAYVWPLFEDEERAA